MTRRLLFVDVEPNLLVGLKRNLRCMRSDWNMNFVSSGETALQEMARRPYDVVATDMRVPGLTGAEPLSLVQARFPQEHASSPIHAQLHPALQACDPSLDQVLLHRSGLTGREKTWMKCCWELPDQGRLP